MQTYFRGFNNWISHSVYNIIFWAYLHQAPRSGNQSTYHSIDLKMHRTIFVLVRFFMDNYIQKKHTRWSHCISEKIFCFFFLMIRNLETFTHFPMTLDCSSSVIENISHIYWLIFFLNKYNHYLNKIKFNSMVAFWIKFKNIKLLIKVN